MAQDLTPFRNAAARSAQGFESVLGAVREQIQIRQQARQMERELDMKKDLFTFQLEEQERIAAPQREAQAQLERTNQILQESKDAYQGILSRFNSQFKNAQQYFGNAVPITVTPNEQTGQPEAIYIDPEAGVIRMPSDMVFRGAIGVNEVASFLKDFDENRENISEDLSSSDTSLMTRDRAASLANQLRQMDAQRFIAVQASNPNMTAPEIMRAIGLNISDVDYRDIQRGLSGFNMIQDRVEERGFNERERNIDALADSIVRNIPNQTLVLRNRGFSPGFTRLFGGESNTEINIGTKTVAELQAAIDEFRSEVNWRGKPRFQGIEDYPQELINFIVNFEELINMHVQNHGRPSTWNDYYLNLDYRSGSGESWFTPQPARSVREQLSQQTNDQQVTDELANQAGV